MRWSLSNRAPERLTSIGTTLAIMALAELFLLRIATRTLINIPGLGRLEVPVRVMAEIGRFTFFASVVFLVALLIGLSGRWIRQGQPRSMAAGAAAVGFLLVAGAGRVGLLDARTVGWFGLGALVLALIGGRGAGRRLVPLTLFTAGAVTAGWSVLGQGDGGGLSVGDVDALLLISEVTTLLAALTSPLLLARPPSRRAVVAGLVATSLVTAALMASPAIVSILALWSFGLPGWLSGLSYSLALGTIVMVGAAALLGGDRNVAIGLVLIVAGGVGMISTYQTGLLLAGLLVLGDAHWAAVPDPATTRLGAERIHPARGEPVAGPVS